MIQSLNDSLWFVLIYCPPAKLLTLALISSLCLQQSIVEELDTVDYVSVYDPL